MGLLDNDPSVQYRGTILPLLNRAVTDPYDDISEYQQTELAVPGLVYEPVRNMALAGGMLTGRVPYDERILAQAALDTPLLGGLLGTATRSLPEGQVLGAFVPGPRLTKDFYESIINTKSKQRSRWSDEGDKKKAYNRIKDVQRERGLLKGEDSLSAPKYYEYELQQLRKNRKAESLVDPLWNKKFTEDFKTSYMIDFPINQIRNRAVLEAVPRNLKKEGWTVGHASSNRSGKKSSRYLVSPDKQFEVRLSDHYLPDTPERMHHRSQTSGPRWNDEVVLTGTESVQSVINSIKQLYNDSFI